MHGANGRAVKGAFHRGSAPLPGQQGRNQQRCKGNGLKSEGSVQPNLPQGNFLQISRKGKEGKEGKRLGGGGRRGKAKSYLLSLKKKNKKKDCPIYIGLPWWLRKERIHLQCKRPGFSPWVGTIPWRRTWQATSVFLPGEAPWTEEPAGYCPLGHRVGHN